KSEAAVIRRTPVEFARNFGVGRAAPPQRGVSRTSVHARAAPSTHDRGLGIRYGQRHGGPIALRDLVVGKKMSEAAPQSRPQFAALLRERELRLEIAQLRAAIEAPALDETCERTLALHQRMHGPR